MNLNKNTSDEKRSLQFDNVYKIDPRPNIETSDSF